ncbi:hypothetical protein JD844_009758 [Phrynosoma platyrhinos]|uniref:TASOR pseudo-PARP domain-containing protein n=1 Tax=Phrynosoma platyrhinos TaxID=52577 RepID=A0ABQ7TG08_PHRPL|nr:hypothetical protein JD844_009758 [Phrynosoma platyrhinos]
MVRNKHLEEEFVAKRTKLREEGKQDKAVFSFLVASNDEVSKICQSGLHIGHSKKQLKIMNELGNPQFGVYLFRYVDIALNYASSHSTPFENIIIFRVTTMEVPQLKLTVPSTSIPTSSVPTSVSAPSKKSKTGQKCPQSPNGHVNPMAVVASQEEKEEEEPPSTISTPLPDCEIDVAP